MRCKCNNTTAEGSACKIKKKAWAAYHSLLQLPSENSPGLCSFFPLFSERSSTPSMIKHGMDVQQQAIAHLNPGQVPVTTFDNLLLLLQNTFNGSGQLQMVSMYML